MCNVTKFKLSLLDCNSCFVSCTVFTQWAILVQAWSYFVFHAQNFSSISSVKWYHKWLRRFFMLLVLLMGVFISDDQDYHFGFVYIYALLQFICAVQHLQLLKMEIPSMNTYGRKVIIVCIISILLCARYLIVAKERN